MEKLILVAVFSAFFGHLVTYAYIKSFAEGKDYTSYMLAYEAFDSCRQELESKINNK